MKKTKFFNVRVLSVFMILVTLLLLSSCKGTQLPAPTDLNISSSGVLTWKSEGEIKEYVILVRTTEYKSTTKRYDLSKLALGDGEYEVKVKAISSNKSSLDSPYSDPITYIVGGSIELAMPTNLRVEDNEILWSAVAGVDQYEVMIEHALGTLKEVVSTNKLALSILDDLEGVVSISVRSKSGTTKVSAYTKPIKYRLALSDDALYEALIRLFLASNEEYDRDDAEEAVTQLLEEIIRPINAYAGIDNASIFDIFARYSELIENEDIMGIISSITFEDSATDIVRFVYGMGVFMLEQIDFDGDREYYETKIALLQGEIARLQAEFAEPTRVYNEALAAFMDTSIYDSYLDQKFWWEELHNIDNYIHTIRFDELYDLLDEPYMYDYYIREVLYYVIQLGQDELLDQLLEEARWLSYLEDDFNDYAFAHNAYLEALAGMDDASEEEIDIYNDYSTALFYYEWLVDFGQIYDCEYQIAHYEDLIDELKLNLEIIEALVDFLIENKDDVLNALTTLVKVQKGTFAVLLDHFSDLNDIQDITSLEIIAIRDALISEVFDGDALPTQDDVDAMISLFKSLANEFGTEIFFEYEEYFEEIYPLLDLWGSLYSPFKNLVRELFSHLTLNDLEAIMNAESEEDLLAIVTDMLLSLNDKEEVQSILEDIKTKVVDYIFESNLVPIIFKLYNPADLETINSIWELIKEEHELVESAVRQAVELMSKLGYDEFLFHALTEKGIGMAYSMFQALLSYVDFAELATLEEADIDDIVELIVKIYREVLVLHEYVTEEEFDDNIDADFFVELIVKMAKAGGGVLDSLFEEIDNDFYNTISHKTLIALIGKFVEIFEEYEDDLSEIFDMFEEFLIDNPVLEAIVGEEDLEDIDVDFLRDGLEDFLNRARELAQLDHNDLTEMDKSDLIEFSYYDYGFIMSLLEYKIEIFDEENIDSFKRDFTDVVESFHSMGLNFEGYLEPGQTFTINEIMLELPQYQAIIREASSYYTSLELSFGMNAYHFDIYIWYWSRDVDIYHSYINPLTNE